MKPELESILWVPFGSESRPSGMDAHRCLLWHPCEGLLIGFHVADDDRFYQGDPGDSSTWLDRTDDATHWAAVNGPKVELPQGIERQRAVSGQEATS